MRTIVHLSRAIAAVLACSLVNAGSATSQTTAELDAYWAEVSRTVGEGDFEGYAALYHPDAVLVTGEVSYPITQAFVRWKPDFVKARTGETRNAVDFRFSQRRNDQTTAHETGIFRIRMEPASGEVTTGYRHFEALLVKKADGWLMLMEYQREPATVDDWNAVN